MKNEGVLFCFACGRVVSPVLVWFWLRQKTCRSFTFPSVFVSEPTSCSGTRCRLRKKNRKENIKAERLLAEPKAYKDERHNTAPPPSAKEFDNIQKMSNNKSRPRRNVRDYLAKQKTPGKTPKQIQKNIGNARARLADAPAAPHISQIQCVLAGKGHNRGGSSARASSGLGRSPPTA